MKNLFIKKISIWAVCLMCILIMTSCGLVTLEPIQTVLPDGGITETVPSDVPTGVVTEEPTAASTDAPEATPIQTPVAGNQTEVDKTEKPTEDVLSQIPAYEGIPYTVINKNIPQFSEEEMAKKDDFETYSTLDSLGRCGVAFANVCQKIMPEDDRESIGQVKPAGWHLVKYDFIDGKYLYNRCHLIGFQLAGENANVNNLITGTRYLNVKGMLPFENEVANYVESTDNHVLYRVTPVYTGDNLIADGVQIEAYSIEDSGKGICFNVFCYNVQPGVIIDYKTGESRLDDSYSEVLPDNTVSPAPSMPAVTQTPSPKPTPAPTATLAPTETPEDNDNTEEKITYVINTNSGKFHYMHCHSVEKIAEHNYMEYTGTREELIENGYSPCGNCHP